MYELNKYTLENKKDIYYTSYQTSVGTVLGYMIGPLILTDTPTVLSSP